MSLPKISVVITSYQPTAKPYLDLLIRSVRNLNYPGDKLEVIIVSPGSYRPRYDGVRTICPEDPTYGMPFGLNFGISAASGDYMFVLNDDVILSKNSLIRLVEMYQSVPTVGLLMPYGNDTNLNRYALQAPVHGAYKLDWLGPGLIDRMLNFDSPYPDGLIIADKLCLYAFLISREAWQKIGPFDENLLNADDIDYSIRSRQAGYINAISLSSVVFHAGGASNKITDEQRAEGARRFNEKWGRS